MKHFLTSLKTSRDLAMVLVMLMSGLRSMEVRGLRLQDINRVDGSLRIWGKGQKERVVPIPTLVLNVLDKYVTLERPHKIDTNHLFVCLKGKSRGQPMTDEGFRSLFRYKRKISGVHKANPHRFRHTFGRDMAISRMSLKAIMELLGHRNFKTALRYIKLATGDIFSEHKRASANIHHYYA